MSELRRGPGRFLPTVGLGALAALALGGGACAAPREVPRAVEPSGESSGAPRSTEGAPPAIAKVEPPGWWADHSVNPVQLLVRGRGLAGLMAASAEGVPGDGVAVERVRVNASGTYAWLDVRIAPGAPAGPRRLRLHAPAGAVEVPFEVTPALEPGGRFRGFSEDDVLYLLMPDRFANGDPANDDPAASRGLHDRAKPRYYHGGDFRGIVDRLPYLKSLGVTAIWMNPVYDNANRLNDREVYDGAAITDYHGYGAVDFYGVEEHFGTLAELRALVDAAHAAGIKIVFDQVANHTGPFHPWANEPPSPSFFHGTVAQHRKGEMEFAPLTQPGTPAEVRAPILDGWFIDLLPDLNQDDPDVARYLIQNRLWWLGVTGADGLREDTLPYVPRTFWRASMAALKRQYPDVRVVGEAFHRDREVVSFFQGGAARFDGVDSGVDALFDFPLLDPMRAAFTGGKDLRPVAEVFAGDAAYVDAHKLVTFASLHDVKRFMGEPGATLEGLALAHALTMTARGIPMIYYGDEIGMPGGDDPDNRRDFPGEWSAAERAAVRASPESDPPGLTAAQAKLLASVKKLGRARRDLEPLRRGAMTAVTATSDTLSFARVTEDAAVAVVFNNAPRARRVEVPVAATRWRDGESLADALGQGPRVKVTRGMVRIELPAKSAAIYAPAR